MESVNRDLAFSLSGETINNNFDGVLFLLLQLRCIGKLNNLSVDAST
jgi:hypothetical protein